MEKQILLDTLAQTILQNHSFDFPTFAEAKQTISMDNGKIQYTYDRLSLVVYSHTLTKEEYSYVGKKLRSDYRLFFSKEDQKQREEYGVLLSFISLNNDLWEYSIRKETRPDFVLSGKKRIGIEVTEFTTETDSVLTSICNQNFGKGLSAEEMKSNAIQKHGKKAKRYDFHEICGTVVVGAGLQDINRNKESYADEIITKHEKYNTDFHLYDSFIILCDARKVIGVTSKWDAIDVVNNARRKSPISNCTVCILYCDDLYTPQLESFVL